jgi:hypothetical protein
MRIAVAPLLLLAAALAAGCGGSGARYGASPAGPSPATTPGAAVTVFAIPSAAAGADRAVLDGAEYVAVRTLPASALSAEKLEAAGTASGLSAAISMARAAGAADVASWELVSAAPDGWRVWRPAAVVEVLRRAGPAASLVEVRSTDWPDACLGISRPDATCLQVITPGYRIVLDDPQQGRIEYHTSRAAAAGPVPAR